mmetsp:Transcript_6561/g.15460  ORF Transcript_6561/g.15460 Transcript_6561/m.15460 type:complete len:206 (-) Transcript_6561:295-912(-)
MILVHHVRNLVDVMFENLLILIVVDVVVDVVMRMMTTSVTLNIAIIIHQEDVLDPEIVEIMIEIMIETTIETMIVIVETLIVMTVDEEMKIEGIIIEREAEVEEIEGIVGTMALIVDPRIVLRPTEILIVPSFLITRLSRHLLMRNWVNFMTIPEVRTQPSESPRRRHLEELDEIQNHLTPHPPWSDLNCESKLGPLELKLTTSP